MLSYVLYDILATVKSLVTFARPGLYAFLCCGMPEMAQSCYVYEQGRQSHRIIGGDIKEDWSLGDGSP